MKPSPYFIASLSVLGLCAFCFLLAVSLRFSKLRALSRRLETNRRSIGGLLAWSGMVFGLLGLGIAAFLITPRYEVKKEESLTKAVPLLIVLGDTNWYMREYRGKPAYEKAMDKIAREIAPHAALMFTTYSDGRAGKEMEFMVPYTYNHEENQRALLKKFLLGLPQKSPAKVDGRNFVQQKQKFDSLFTITGSGATLVNNHNFARAIENRRKGVPIVDEKPSVFLLILVGTNKEIIGDHYLFNAGKDITLGKSGSGAEYAVIRLDDFGAIDEATLKAFTAKLRAPERKMTFVSYGMDFILDRTGFIRVFLILISLMSLELLLGGMSSKITVRTRYPEGGKE